MTGCSIAIQHAVTFTEEWEIVWPECYRMGKVLVDQKGNAYVSGQTWEPIDFDPGDGEVLYTPPIESPPLNNYQPPNYYCVDFLISIGPDGDFRWSKTFSVNQPQFRGTPPDFELGPNGSIYLSGVIRGTRMFGPDPEGTVETYERGAGDSTSFIAELDADGEFIWFREWEQDEEDFSSQGPYARFIDVTPDGNLVVAGEFYKTVDFDPDPESEVLRTTRALNEPGNFVCLFDAAGEFKWVRTFGAGIAQAAGDFLLYKYGYVYTAGIEVNSKGEIYLAGNTSSLLELEINGVPTKFEPVGDNDLLLIQLDQSGGIKWASLWGGVSCDYMGGISIGEDDCLYLFGWFNEAFDFDPGPDEYPVKMHEWEFKGRNMDGKMTTFKSSGSGFLSKFRPEGSVEWVYTWPHAFECHRDPFSRTPGLDRINFTCGVDGCLFIVSGYDRIHTSAKTTSGVHENSIHCFNTDGVYLGGDKWGKQFINSRLGIATGTDGSVYVCGPSSNGAYLKRFTAEIEE